MRLDRLFIVSVVCLASGLSLIFGYCHGSVGANAVWPLDGCSLQIATTTTGHGALGGLCLTAPGAGLLLCTTLVAIINQIRLLSARKSES
jgi:hypothetical protein